MIKFNKLARLMHVSFLATAFMSYGMQGSQEVPRTPERESVKRELFGEAPGAPAAKRKKATLSVPIDEESVGKYNLTPQRSPTREQRLRIGISPQAVLVRAENSARSVFDELARPDSAETVLKIFVDWYQKFPTILSKIKWRTAEDRRAEAQADFKFNLYAALHHILLSCLAQSSSGMSSQKIDHGDEFCTSSLRLGGYMIQSSLTKGDLKALHKIRYVDGSIVCPRYNQDNKIKQACMNYLFGQEESPAFQQVLQDLLIAIPAKLHVNKEQYYHALIYGVIHFMGSNFSIIEAYSGEGRADLVLMSNIGMQYCIVEFKFNRSVQEALDQIEAMHYNKYFGDHEVVAVGINIQQEPFQVTCGKKIIHCATPDVQMKDGIASATFLL